MTKDSPGQPAPPPREAPDRTEPKTATATATAADRARLALEKKRERYVWYYLGYFLFGIHLVAFVMIFAVRHAK
ncbi:hypothetical protein ABZ858_28635 [Streptomyces sp. NPDC047017]|uniref:hypothetical protein n=1 Tax=Streptomyces sp. NPDC047017 TaxID=3155024 RepID=UPI003403420E